MTCKHPVLVENKDPLRSKFIDLKCIECSHELNISEYKDWIKKYNFDFGRDTRFYSLEQMFLIGDKTFTKKDLKKESK